MGNSDNQGLEREIAQFIIETLALEDMSAEDIPSDLPLFAEGLGLDSIDALELGVALQKRYGVQVDPKGNDTVTHFSCVRNLACLVAEQRQA